MKLRPRHCSCMWSDSVYLLRSAGWQQACTQCLLTHVVDSLSSYRNHSLIMNFYLLGFHHIFCFSLISWPQQLLHLICTLVIFILPSVLSALLAAERTVMSGRPTLCSRVRRLNNCSSDFHEMCSFTVPGARVLIVLVPS